MDDFERLEELQIGVSTSPLGSGGMRSKVVAAEMATAAGIPATILNGTRPGAIARAVAGEPEGTRFAVQRQRVSSFKLWLKYAKPSHGRVVVDGGAERALRERGTSLLPVGVVAVEGHFQAGDAVDVAADGRAIGKGIVNYSAEELRSIKGLKTDEVRRGCRGRARRPCTATISCSTEACAALLSSHGHDSHFGSGHLRGGARDASRVLARLDGATRAAALEAMASALEARSDEILAANERDMEAGAAAEIGSALLDRLRLTEERLAGIAADVRVIAWLPDPVGETIEGHRLPNGLDVRKVRVPLGVVAVVYEARPNVTIDCSALCIKSGNAIVLRGSSIAAHSNAVLATVAREAVVAAGLPAAAVSLVAGGGREELAELATQSEFVDLIIPRGGEG